uniref:Uncharacterized protein n=1 Tax=Physcomitrium patens TaxID=3218 RepID=A0A2K1KGG8_PHYPA|nr:hypothetical protein PHYPA_009246 [Physcomitrium patens]
MFSGFSEVVGIVVLCRGREPSVEGEGGQGRLHRTEMDVVVVFDIEVERKAGGVLPLTSIGVDVIPCWKRSACCFGDIVNRVLAE